MNSFWSSFFDQLRTCGRSAAWFLVTLGLFFVLLIVAAVAIDTGHGDSVIVAVLIAASFFAVMLTVSIRRAILWRREKYRTGKLSDDELSKARAKLARRGKPAAFATASPPKLRARPTAGEIY